MAKPQYPFREAFEKHTALVYFRPSAGVMLRQLTYFSMVEDTGFPLNHG